MQSFFERFGASVAVAFGLGMLLALVILPITTNAQSSRSVVQNVTEDVESNANERAIEQQQAVNEKKEEALANALQKQQEAKLKVCQKREQKVLDLMARISDRGQRQADVFTKIADRTNAFYIEKGYNLANYTELLGNVNQARTLAEAQVNRQSELGVLFSCEHENPKASVTAFKLQLKREIEALKAYRTAVQEFIVGVKSAHEAAEAEATENAENAEKESTEEPAQEELND